MIDFSKHPDGFSSTIMVVKATSASAKAHWLATASIVIQAVLLGYVSGSQFFPLVISIWAIAAGITSWKMVLPDSGNKWLFTFVALGFCLFHLFFPFEFTLDEHYFGTPVFHVLARLLIAVQTVTLCLKTPTDRPPLWLTGVGIVCLPIAFNVRVHEQDHQWVLVGVLTYVVVAALYSSEWRTSASQSNSHHRWSRFVVLTLALATSLSLGGGSAVALQRYDREIEWFLGDFLGYRPPSARPGFTTSGRLSDVSNWKTTQADEVAMVAFSDKAPGYLRGVVFDTYQTPEWDKSWTVWTTDAETDGDAEPQILPVVTPPRGLRGIDSEHLLSRVMDQAQGPWSSIQVELQNPRGPHFFAPLKTAYISVKQGNIVRELHGTLQASQRPRSAAYTLITTDIPSRNRLDDDERARTTRLNPDLSPPIRRIANELFTDCRTNADKINRVETWFQNNFEYQLGIDIPQGVDPLTHFLTERPSAHCEYFATATAVLLRLAGVPTRYVTGYVATERNDIGGYWLARNKDAHAWVEAYDDRQQQWVIVESTPASGRPQPRSAPFWLQAPEAVKQYWSRLQDLVRDQGVAGMLLELWSLLWSIPGLVALMLILIAPLLWRSRHLPRWSRPRDEARLQSMHALLKRMDQQAKRHELERREGETLRQFARRIRETDVDPQWAHTLADCYDLYSMHRFRGRTDSAAVQEVDTVLSNVPEPTQFKNRL